MEEKKKHKLMIGIEVILLGMILAIVGTNAASSNPPSNGVSYSKNSQTTVEGALNDLYNKANYGNANAKHILKDKTALVEGIEITGTMPNRGTVSKTISSGETYIIPSGYHSGSGKVVCAKGIVTDSTPVNPTISDVKIGDFVSYASNSKIYTIRSADTGYEVDQTINPNELKVWRVIRKNDNGTIEIMSHGVSSTKVSFYGYVGYMNYIGTLNKIARQYENSTYTVGSRHMGYDGKEPEYLSSITERFEDGGYIKDMELIRKIPFYTCSTSYLASRDSAMNGLRTVLPDDSPTMLACVFTTVKLSSSRGELGASNSIHPIVVLKSTLKITGGDGTHDSPYTLGV